MREKKIKAKWIAKLPEGARLKVKRGDEVEKEGVLLEIQSGVVEVVDMSVILSEIKVGEEESFRDMWIGREVVEGEVLYKSRGVFPKTFRAPKSGIIRKIDEFFNFEIWQKGELVREIKSPVRAKVIGIDRERVVLEFQAYEYGGGGLVLGKAWADGPIRYVKKIGDMDYCMCGKFVALDKLNPAILMKAEVLGVKGFILVGGDAGDEIVSGLPVMSVSYEVWQRIDEVNKRSPDSRMLLNSKTGRLLIVVE